MTTTVYAGRFDFEDGGTYCGGWEDGKAHGHGVCTGPKAMGEFSGMWQFGYEVSGVYMWPSGNCYQGQWMSGKRHGLGVEKKQRWLYKGEWSQGFKGRYGVRVSENCGAKYEGTWANGLQDGYGSETYADGGTYFGQMSQGMRNGYGIRKSVSYGVASRYRSKDVKDSLTSLRSEEGDERVQRDRDRRFDENRGGFVLRAKSDIIEDLTGNSSSIAYMPNSSNSGGAGGIMSNVLNGLLRRRRNSLGQNHEKNVGFRNKIMTKLKKQKSVGDIDDVNATISAGGSHILHLNPNNTTSSSSRAKKSSFRSTSSNNSVDSRASNRTAPPGLGLNSASLAGFHNTISNSANQDDGEHSFISQDEITDVNCIEVYMGEWKQDKRTGYGIAERSDGLKYEGEWFNNKKNGYGVTTFKDGTKEEGKYKNNVLCTDKKKTAKLLLLRTNKTRQKIDAAVNAALKAGQIAQQRADIALARAVNARTKSHAAELAAKQARADSEFARIRAHEVAPDFIQPGEIKKIPEIILDIDRMNTYAPQQSGLADPVAFNNISPGQFRKMQQPLNVQLKQENYLDSLMRTSGGGNNQNSLENYLNWQQQQQQQNYNTSHSSTPPPIIRNNQHQQTPTRTFSANQFYDNNLNSPHQQQRNQFLQQNSLDFPTNNIISSNNQLLLHPSIDPITGQKLNNDMLGLNQLDAQALAQYQQMHPNYMQQQQQTRNKLQQQNFSFEEQLPNSYFDGGVNHRMNLLQQAQSHSFNVDMLSSTNADMSNQQELIMQQQQQQQHGYFQNSSAFNRNNPKRNTLKRAQRVNDNSAEDLPNSNLPDMSGLSPQQQQHLMMLRNQQYSNNSESGIGTGSSNYTNATNSAHGTSDLLHAPPTVHHHHHPSHIRHAQPPNTNEAKPGESGNSSTIANSVPGEEHSKATIPRRKSLPSIVKTKSFKEDETAHSSSDLNDKNQETFIIENGIKKRVTEKSNSALGPNKLGDELKSKAYADYGQDEEGTLDKRRIKNYDEDQTPQLPRRIVIESITTLNSPLNKTSSKRVSMPSIAAYLNPKFANKVMSREEANRLSSQRREELRKNRELESNRTLRLKTMLKDVFLRNRVFMFIILFNISLAIWFLQMLK